MDLAKPSDWNMADRSPCLVLGKSCRGGCGNNGDDDGDEMERALTKHGAATVVTMVSGRRSDGGGERMLCCGVLLCFCVFTYLRRAMLCVRG